MKKLIFLLLLTQTPSQSKVIWKGIGVGTSLRVVTTSSNGFYEQLLPAGVPINDATLLPMMVELGNLAKTTPTVNTILVKYVTEIDDPNGIKVWP